MDTSKQHGASKSFYWIGSLKNGHSMWSHFSKGAQLKCCYRKIYGRQMFRPDQNGNHAIALFFQQHFFPCHYIAQLSFRVGSFFLFFFFGSKRERQNESVYSQFVKWAYKFFLRIESNDVVIFHNFVQHNIFTVHLRVAPVQLNSKQWLHWIEHKIPAHCRHTASLEYFSRFVCLLMLVNV